MEKRKKILFTSALVVLFALTQTMLFGLANFFSFYQDHSLFYSYAEIFAAFLFFLLPSIFAVDFAKDYWPLSWPNPLQKNWGRVVAAHAIAFSALMIHYAGNHTMQTALGVKRFENRFFQCLPHAPWPAQTSWGQAVAHKFFQNTSISWQYSWYTLEDICRLENLRTSFSPLKTDLPHHCTDQKKYSCLINTLEHLTGHAPLGTAGVVLAQDFLEEVRDFEWEKSKQIYRNTRGLASHQQGRSAQIEISQAREKLKLLEQHLVRILDSFDWASRAGMLSTVEFQTVRFPGRAVASLSTLEKKALSQYSKKASASQWSDFFEFISSPPRSENGMELPIGPEIWPSVRLQSIDHYIRGEFFNSARNLIGLEGVATLQSMQYILIHAPLPHPEKLAYTQHIQDLTKRYGL